MSSIRILWKDKMAFDCQIGNHMVRMDSSSVYGDDSGPSPKSTMLATLAACTGMDVVGILEKMRVDLFDFELEVDGDLTDDHPRVYSEIRLKYMFKGSELDQKKIERAVQLSKEKYCGISAMLAQACPIKYVIEFI